MGFHQTVLQHIDKITVSNAINYVVRKSQKGINNLITSVFALTSLIFVITVIKEFDYKPYTRFLFSNSAEGYSLDNIHISA